MACTNSAIKFQFLIKTVRITTSHYHQLRVCLKRKSKGSKSKNYAVTSPVNILNEVIQFPTTMDYDQNAKTYAPKMLDLLLELRQNSTDEWVSIQTQINLAQFVEGCTKAIGIRKSGIEAEIAIHGSTTLQNQRNSQILSTQEARRFSKSSGKILINDEKSEALKTPFLKAPTEARTTRKSKGWLTKTEQQTFADLTNKHIRSAVPRPSRSQVHIEQAVKKIQQSSNWDKCSLDYQRAKYIKKKKNVQFNEQYVVQKHIYDHGELQGSNDANHCDSVGTFSRDESVGVIIELKGQNKKMKQEIEELKLKVSEQENQNDQMSKTVISRLKHDLAAKTQQVRQLQEQLNKLKCQKRSQEDNILQLKKTVSDLQSNKKDNIGTLLTPNMLRNSRMQPNWKDQYAKLKQASEAQICQLNQKLKNAKKELSQTKIEVVQVINCSSKECLKQRKDLNNINKLLKKTIQQLHQKLKTKDRLLQNYSTLKADKEKEGTGTLKKQQQKWQAERILLQTQIRQLRSHMTRSTSHRQSITEHFVKRSEKQNIQKELEKMRKTLYENNKQRQNEFKKLQQQVVNCKLQTMNVLNAVQQFGGRALYDQVSAALFESPQ